MKKELKVNSDEYFMSMILSVFVFCCVLFLRFNEFSLILSSEKRPAIDW